MKKNATRIELLAEIKKLKKAAATREIERGFFLSTLSAALNDVLVDLTMGDLVECGKELQRVIQIVREVRELSEKLTAEAA